LAVHPLAPSLERVVEPESPSTGKRNATSARNLIGRFEDLARRPDPVKPLEEWTTEERLEALIDTRGMWEEEIEAWCWEQGLTIADLERWRREAATALDRSHRGVVTAPLSAA